MGDRAYAAGYIGGWGFFMTIFGLAMYDMDNIVVKIVGAIVTVLGVLTLLMAGGVAVGAIK